MSITTKAYLAAFGQVLIIGLSFMFVKLSLAYTNIIDLLFWRFLAAYLALVLLKPILAPLVLGNKSTAGAAAAQVKPAKSTAELLQFALIALFFPILFFGLQAWGLLYTSSVEAGIMFAIVPILVAVLSNFMLGEQVSLKQVGFICLSIAGVVFFLVISNHAANQAAQESLAAQAATLTNAESSAQVAQAAQVAQVAKEASASTTNLSLSSGWVVGVLLLFGSSCAAAMYQVLSRKLRALGPANIAANVTAMGFFFFTLVALVYHLYVGSFSELIKPLLAPTFIVSILYLGVLSSLVTSLLTSYALAHLPAAKVSVFNNLSPMIALFAGVLILGEHFDPLYLVGIALTLLGVVGTSMAKTKTS